MKDLLADALTETGLSKTQFAKELGFNKSFVLRVLNGEKTLSEKMLAAVMDMPGISDNTKSEINKKFYCGLFGRELTDDIHYFIDKINGFESFLNKKNNIFIRRESLENIISNGNKSAVYCIVNRSELTEFAAFLAEKASKIEKGIFYTNFRIDSSAVSDSVYSVMSDRDFSLNVDFCRLVSIPSKNNRKILNLVFESAKWGDIFLNTHFRTGESTSVDSVFPEFIITDDAVLCFNYKNGNGIVLSDRTAIDLYKIIFSKLKSDYQPVCNFIEDELSSFFGGSLTENELLCGIDGSPCVAAFLNYDISNNITHSFLPQREALINGVLHYYQSQEFNPNYVKYTTEKALKEFLNNGSLKEITEHYASVIPIEQRQIMFENMLNIEKYPVRQRLLDDKHLNPYNEMIIDIHSRKVHLALHPTCPQSKARFVELSIQLYYNAFPELERLMKSTVEYLENPSYYHEDKYLKYIIEQCIIFCKSQKPDQ